MVAVPLPLFSGLVGPVLATVEIVGFQAQTAPTTGFGFLHQLTTINRETNYQTIGSTNSGAVLVVQIPNFRRERCSVAEEVPHELVDFDAIGGGATVLARCSGRITGLCS